MSKHLIIPDTQIKPGVNTKHIEWAARFANEKRPDVIIQLGDWYDFNSLNSYDKKKAIENRRIQKDIEVGNRCLDTFMSILDYKPRLVFLIGNHEERLQRYLGDHPELEGLFGYENFGFYKHGWEVYPFLQPVTIDGIDYCHYFPRGPGGYITQSKRGAPSAQTQLNREMRSCTAGHKQGFDYSVRPRGKRQIHGLIAGSFYQHKEDYLTPAGNHHWRGIILKHRVNKGDYDICVVSLDYLKEKYS